MKRHGLTRREFIKLTGAGLAAGAVGMPALAAGRGRRSRRVIVLGIDGMDPVLLDRFVREGRMPNCAKLIAGGSFSRLQTSDPPQSPVAWSNFISGTNPGGHGIYDFIARDPSTLVPYLSTSEMGDAGKTIGVAGYDIPLSGRRMVNLRKGPTFWKDLQEQGVDCTVLKIPANFPPTECRSRSISGMGTPDIHGSYGLFTFYTDKASEVPRDVPGGRVVNVGSHDNTIDCVLPGPVNTLRRDRGNVNIPFTVFADPSNPAVLVSVQGKEFILKEGEWSDWVVLSFPLVPHIAEVPGICRFFLRKARNDFALYVTPVNIDPAAPSLPISTPPRYSADLVSRIGRFYTQGMAEDTKALSAGMLSDDEYKQLAVNVLNENIRMFDSEFGRFESGFFFCYFSSLDLNSHVFWRALDRGHPLYSAGLAAKQGDFIPWLYSQMDAVVGKAMARLDASSMLMVMSDHGFASFRRQFNLNSWLMDNGYAGAVPSASRGSAGYFQDTDWTQTRAYGLGINSLYLNIKGREPQGVVGQGSEKDALMAELVSKLEAVRDPVTGEQVITHAYRGSDIYSGPYAGSAPDVVVGYNRGYRASWDTVLGKYPKEHFADNTDPWSGDHSIDAPHVPGVLLCNRPVKASRPALSDLAPTIMDQFGVEPSDGMTGKPVL
ncbi:MAG: alkaline phosphatase family protein [bacterium]